MWNVRQISDVTCGYVRERETESHVTTDTNSYRMKVGLSVRTRVNLRETNVNLSETKVNNDCEYS